MEFGLIEKQRMQAVFENAFKPTAYLYNLLGRELILNDDEIDFVNLFSHTTVAPYVSPCNQGQPVFAESALARRYKLSYTKMRDAITACDVLDTAVFAKNVTFETGGNSDLQKYNLGVLKVLASQARALQNLNEMQMIGFLTEGKINTSSEFGNGELIDFKRDASLNLAALTAANQWTTATSSVLDSIQKAADLLQAQGYILSDIVMPSSIYSVFVKHQEVAAYRKEFRDLGMPNPLPQVANGVKVSSFGTDYTIHSYNETYTKLVNGAKQLNYFLDPKKVIFIGKRTDGHPILKSYGKIKNLDAIKSSQQNSKVYTNVYSNEGIDSIVTEAAPLVIGDPNCALSLQVIA